jgi:hypothetical protein
MTLLKSQLSNKTRGSAFGLATLISTGNPAGLIVSTGMKA